MGEEGRTYIINNWCGFLTTCSTPVIDTNDLNEVIVEIRLVTSDVCFLSCETTGGVASTTGTVSSYTLRNVGFTISNIIFNDPLYYNMKDSKLLGDGLTIGYDTYINTRGGQNAKTTSINIYKLELVLLKMYC